MKSLLAIACMVVLVPVFLACDPGTGAAIHFDRKPLLENWAHQLMIPAYDTLAKHTAQLQEVATDFVEAPDATSLSSLRAAWRNAYQVYQHVAFYNLGPAEEQLLNQTLNTFPATKNDIEDNVSSGTYDLATISNYDAKGFPALDYLLYGLAEDEADVLAYYTTDENASHRRQYLLDVVEDIDVHSKLVLEAWQETGGNYVATFVSRTGVDAGGAVSMLINAMVQYLERDLRDAKIGIPLGVRSLNVPIPANCEARYGQQSVALASASIKTLQNIYTGTGELNSIGLDDYLVAINARYQGTSLDEAIREQLSLAITKIGAIPEPLEETVMNNQTPPTEAYQALQKLTLLLKADMTSSLGILVTYQDNDGD